MLEMVIYVPMRIVPYKQVEKLITMEEDFLIIVNLMQETIILLHLNWIELLVVINCEL